MLETFDGLRPTEALLRETDRLAQQRDVKRAIKRRRRLLLSESVRTERAERELLALLGPEPRPGAAELTRRLEIRRMVDEMNQRSGEEGRLARRLLDSILVEVSFYIPEQLRSGGDLAGVALSLEVAAEIRAIVDSAPP
jgi:hypothetical protein